MTKQLLSQRQVRWAEVLADYNFVIKHKKGTENARADALSRQRDEKWEPKGLTLLTTLRTLLQKGPPGETEDEKITWVHEEYGHPGIWKTFHLYRDLGLGATQRSKIQRHIGRCQTCNMAKKGTTKPQGTLQPLDPACEPWQRISMDFVTGLPLARDPADNNTYDAIWTILDHHTKFALMIPTRTNLDTEQLVHLMTREVLGKYGYPREIVSDRDKLFTSELWTDFTQATGMHHRMTSAYHPQSNGATERLNQTMEQMLRSEVREDPATWAERLPHIQYAYNSMRHTATGESPFEAMYGWYPLPYGWETRKRDHPRTKPRKEVTHWATKRTETRERITQRLKEGYNEANYNLKRRPTPDWEPGQKVYLDITHMKLQKNKLDTPWKGPFEVEERIGEYSPSYRLRLPKDTKIHPVFHCSHLKEAPRDAELLTTWKTIAPNEWEVEAIKEHRNGARGSEYLVKWKGFGEEDNTWEPEFHLNNAKQVLRDFWKPIKPGTLPVDPLLKHTHREPPHDHRQKRTPRDPNPGREPSTATHGRRRQTRSQKKPLYRMQVQAQEGNHQPSKKPRPQQSDRRCDAPNHDADGGWRRPEPGPRQERTGSGRAVPGGGSPLPRGGSPPHPDLVFRPQTQTLREALMGYVRI
jgi:transposase InsO family protein